MSWLSRTLFGTPTVNSQPQQSDDARDEPQTLHTASSPGTSPRSSPSDGESEASSNRSSARSTVVSGGPRHSERVARKRRSLPRLRTSGPTAMFESRQAGLTSENRKDGSMIPPSGANVVDPAAPPMAPKPADPDPLPSPTQEAIKDGVIPTAPDVSGGLVSEACTFAKH